MRLAWADVARGGAMILVVLAHALQLMDVYGWQNGFLDTLNLYLTAVRMPLFFLVAGIFGATAIRRSWGGLFASRLAVLLYLYFLWMLMRAVWFSFVPWPLSDVHPWLALAMSPVWPTNGLWFLYALIVYLVVGKLTVRLPAWIPLMAAGALAVAAAMRCRPHGRQHRVAIDHDLRVLLPARSTAAGPLARHRRAREPPAARRPRSSSCPPSMMAFSFVPGPLRGIGRVALSRRLRRGVPHHRGDDREGGAAGARRSGTSASARSRSTSCTR